MKYMLYVVATHLRARVDFGNQCFADGLAESGKPLR